jgi:hypothetical protein
MRPSDIEPTTEELMLLLDDEERARLSSPGIPDDEKAEILAKLQSWRETVAEEEVADEPLPDLPEV